MRVLVIDDAASVRERFASTLAEIPGIEVLEAEDLARAAELLRAARPEVVVLDVRLRNESGLAFAPSVKAAQPDTLLLMWTNEPSERMRRECLALGADHFFDKSGDLDRLLRTVVEVAAARH